MIGEEKHNCLLKIEATEKAYKMHLEGTGDEILALLAVSIAEVISRLTEYDDKEEDADIVNLAAKDALRREKN